MVGRPLLILFFIGEAPWSVSPTRLCVSIVLSLFLLFLLFRNLDDDAFVRDMMRVCVCREDSLEYLMRSLVVPELILP